MTTLHKTAVMFGSLVVAVLLIGFWSAGERSPSQVLTVKARSIASSPASGSLAVIDLKLARPAVVNLYALEYKADDRWLSTTVPKLVSDDFEKIFSVQAALRGRCVGTLHGLTNSSWRMTFEVIEPRTGWAGLKERLEKPIGYRRAGGWLNVLFGSRPVRYTGLCYLVKSEEIMP